VLYVCIPKRGLSGIEVCLLDCRRDFFKNVDRISRALLAKLEQDLSKMVEHSSPVL
jgi:hypothetical protein